MSKKIHLALKKKTSSLALIKIGLVFVWKRPGLVIINLESVSHREEEIIEGKLYQSLLFILGSSDIILPSPGQGGER